MDDFDSVVQKKRDEVMPWIGLYIAAASAVCTLAMAIDVFNGFRSKKFWFPCKYFFLNAASLTLLGTAMKLPMDLNANLLYDADWLSKIDNGNGDSRIDDPGRLLDTNDSVAAFYFYNRVPLSPSSVICLLAAINLLKRYITWFIFLHKVTLGYTVSVYGHYTKWILIIQSIGVVVGTIAPISRWFLAIRFKCLMTSRKISFREHLKIEKHWTQTLVHWRESFLGLEIQDSKCAKYLHNVKWFALTLLIGVQIMMVLVSKLLLLISALLATPFFLHFKKFNARRLSKVTTSNHMGSKSGGDTDLNLNPFVLLLDGEPELPQRTLKEICSQADKVIEIGRRQQPQDLIHLLSMFGNFSGVREFDSYLVPSLHSQEPPNCWILPLVTLTTIAISLPEVAYTHKATQLMRSMNEGLSLVKLIEKTLDENGELVNIRNAVDVAWAGVAIYRKWQGIDLKRISLTCRNSKNVLQELSSNEMVVEFKRTVTDFQMENPLNWPANVIAANSMYRISQSILLSYQEENEQTDCQQENGQTNCQRKNEQTNEGLVERLSNMIADILAACFTNLVRVIVTSVTGMP
ncbi:UNVERIFIED_CONTAM: hypothetical protein Slati_3543600 [Sesamum latifolium]|uniref:Uncharacterized protein n=1 Tax=Sesamum latifolium TaxID=2727402 RepID=A0AAW2UJB9_9LAMI